MEADDGLRDLGRAMRARLVHRGPDSEGEFVDQHVVLSIRRLRVVDLETGDQPQCNETGEIWTVFNGEIYNFRELRDRLISAGHRLRTEHSDTETIVHLYEDHGPAFVEHLEGMFAIALWDQRSRTLVLARDRMGKKPLLYAARNGSISFASEHHALLPALCCVPEVDPEAMSAYLRLGYVPAPLDAIRGVRKLAPAHRLVWRNGEMRIERYWDVALGGVAAPITEHEAIEETRRLIDRAVARRMIADVPIGAFLSGGVDSSGVVATMARQAGRVRTFTIGFEESDFSEVEHARRIARRYGTEHHEQIVRASAIDVLPTLVRHYGEPYADSSAVPTYYLSRLTRQHVTVALNGDGGDEIFGGYDRYLAARLATAADRIPDGARRAVAAIAGAVLPDSTSVFSRSRRLRRFAQALTIPATDRYLRWSGVFDTQQLSELLPPASPLSGFGLPRGMDEPAWRRDPVRAAQRFDLDTYLPDDLLVKVDIAGMANSLEVRSPLLDRELVEFCAGLPSGLLIRGLEKKYLLKKAFADRVPAENMYRRKQGFGMPVATWLRTELRDMLGDVVLSKTALGRGYFVPTALHNLASEHLAGRADHAPRLWALLVLELWHREFIDPPVRA